MLDSLSKIVWDLAKFCVWLAFMFAAFPAGSWSKFFADGFSLLCFVWFVITLIEALNKDKS